MSDAPYPIPAEALDDRLAWVGASGAGKTYNAGTAIERLLASSARAVIADPLGVWWGLRLKADGRTPAYPLVIFGGPHGDLPLNEHVGALIGEAAAGMAESCIVDLSDIGTAAGERRFMGAFLRALYHKASGEPLHLVLDEADMWAPQTIREKDGDAGKLFAITERIVRRGRIAGFVPWLITQRPAELSKSVLSQVDGLVAMQLTAPQDRDALDAWIGGQADKTEGQRIKAQFATLERGQGVVWLPRRGILQTSQFPAKATFDSSRTPKRGEARQTVELKPLDLGALKDRLATVEAEAKANDPRALKAEIAKLKAASAAPPQAGHTRQEVEDADRAGFLRGVEEGERRGSSAGQAVMLTRVQAALGGLRVDGTPSDVPTHRSAPSPATAAPLRQTPAGAPKAQNATGALGLVAAAASVHPVRLTWGQIAVVAGRKPSGGHFNSSRKTALDNGWLDDAGGLVSATATGMAAAGVEPVSGDPVEVFAAALPQPAAKMFAAIRERPGVTVTGLASVLQMQPRGGHWNTGMSMLRKNGLITERGDALYVSEMTA